MIANYSDRTVAEYLAMSRTIAAGNATVGDVLARRMPYAEGELPELARLTHRHIFSGAFGDDAGRFRLPGVAVYAGHDNHEFAGVPGSEIESRLRELGALRIPVGPTNVDRFAYWAAIFVREFFVVHPFRDGNGRTARAIVIAAAGYAGVDVGWPGGTRRERTADQGEYLRALEYAHAHLGLTRAAHRLGMREYRDPYLPLAKWWRARLRSEAEIETMIDSLIEVDLDGPVDELLADLEGTQRERERQAAYDTAFARWLEEPAVSNLRLSAERTKRLRQP